MVKKNLLIVVTTFQWSWTLHISEYADLLGQWFNIKVIEPRWKNKDLLNWADVIIGQNVASLFFLKGYLEKTVLRVGNIKSFSPERHGNDLSKCGAIITQSKEHMAGYEIYNPKTYIIQNGLNLDLFKPSVGKERKFTVGYCANITGVNRTARGIDVFDDAVENMDIRVRMIIRGIHNYKHVEMPERFYSKIDCFVAPYTTAGCCNAVMESLACGVPVVATKIGYHGENLADGENVLFVDKTEESIRIAIQRLMDDKSLREKLALNGRVFAEKHHDLNETIKKYKAILDEV